MRSSPRSPPSLRHLFIYPTWSVPPRIPARMNTAADGPLYTRSASTGEVAYSEIKSWILRGAVPVGAQASRGAHRRAPRGVPDASTGGATAPLR